MIFLFLQHTVNGIIEQKGAADTEKSDSKPKYMTNGSPNEIQVEGGVEM